ncbi:MAG: hypothetical protein KC561_12105, partial [Myxococcales bacterium]|nr:hypothetical protein [Myxococcales bacterium]
DEFIEPGPSRGGFSAGQVEHRSHAASLEERSAEHISVEDDFVDEDDFGDGDYEINLDDLSEEEDELVDVSYVGPEIQGASIISDDDSDEDDLDIRPDFAASGHPGWGEEASRLSLKDIQMLADERGDDTAEYDDPHRVDTAEIVAQPEPDFDIDLEDEPEPIHTPSPRRTEPTPRYSPTPAAARGVRQSGHSPSANREAPTSPKAATPRESADRTTQPSARYRAVEAPAKAGAETWGDRSGELLERAIVHQSLGDYAASQKLVEKLLAKNPHDSKALELEAENHKRMERQYLARLGSIEARPKVILSPEQLVWHNLDALKGFVLSRVDGDLTVQDIVDIVHLPRLDTIRLLAELVTDGIIQSR